MIKIGFIGPPGAGKTTVAQFFSAKIRFITKKRVELIDEHARWFVSNFGETNVSDQYLISHIQIDKENTISKNINYLITDSPAFLAEIYARYNINWNNNKQVYYLKEIINLLKDNYHSYDYLFYLLPIKNNQSINDGKRIHTNKQTIKKINYLIKSFLELNKINSIRISGDLNTRVYKCLKIVLNNR